MNKYEQLFTAFNAEYPQVYTRLVAMARAMKARGFSQYSIKTLWCVLRFEIDLAPAPLPYKLNDMLHSRYARRIMESETDLEGFFKLRELRTA